MAQADGNLLEKQAAFESVGRMRARSDFEKTASIEKTAADAVIPLFETGISAFNDYTDSGRPSMTPVELLKVGSMFGRRGGLAKIASACGLPLATDMAEELVGVAYHEDYDLVADYGELEKTAWVGGLGGLLRVGRAGVAGAAGTAKAGVKGAWRAAASGVKAARKPRYVTPKAGFRNTLWGRLTGRPAQWQKAAPLRKATLTERLGYGRRQAGGHWKRHGSRSVAQAKETATAGREAARRQVRAASAPKPTPTPAPQPAPAQASGTPKGWRSDAELRAREKLRQAKGWKTHEGKPAVDAVKPQPRVPAKTAPKAPADQAAAPAAAELTPGQAAQQGLKDFAGKELYRTQAGTVFKGQHALGAGGVGLAGLGYMAMRKPSSSSAGY